MMERKRRQRAKHTSPIFLLVGLCVLGALLNAPASDAESPMVLLDAAFTDQVLDREPGQRLTTFTLGANPTQARLWFWVRIHCGDLCLAGGAASPKVPIMVKWAFQEGDRYLVHRTVRLTVESMTWRTWAYKESLKPGRWRVVVFNDQGPVCLDEQCEFHVDVRP